MLTFSIQAVYFKEHRIQAVTFLSSLLSQTFFPAVILFPSYCNFQPRPPPSPDVVGFLSRIRRTLFASRCFLSSATGRNQTHFVSQSIRSPNYGYGNNRKSMILRGFPDIVEIATAYFSKRESESISVKRYANFHQDNFNRFVFYLSRLYAIDQFHRSS